MRFKNCSHQRLNQQLRRLKRRFSSTYSLANSTVSYLTAYRKAIVLMAPRGTQDNSLVLLSGVSSAPISDSSVEFNTELALGVSCRAASGEEEYQVVCEPW